MYESLKKTRKKIEEIFFSKPSFPRLSCFKDVKIFLQKKKTNQEKVLLIIYHFIVFTFYLFAYLFSYV